MCISVDHGSSILPVKIEFRFWYDNKFYEETNKATRAYFTSNGNKLRR